MNPRKELSPATKLRKKIVRVSPPGVISAVSNPLPETRAGSTGEYAQSRSFRVDKITALQEAGKILAEMPYTKALAVRRAMQTLQERGRPPFVGLNAIVRTVNRDVKKHNARVKPGESAYRQVTRTIDNMFDTDLGSPILPGDIPLPESPLGAFFTPDRTFTPSHGGRELRGRNYFVSYPPDLSLGQRLGVMSRDVHDGMKVLAETDRSGLKNIRDYFLYTGVLDYLKIHALTLFHAVTFNERFMRVPTGNDNTQRASYERERKDAFALARDSVRMYYQSVLGLPYDKEVKISDLSRRFNGLASYVADEYSRPDFNGRSTTGRDQLRYPEVNNPLVIGLGAHEATLRYPNTDLIIGIPSGGTELAFCTQLFYELADRKVDVLQVPISHRLHRNSRLFAQVFGRDHGRDVADKNVLIEDDNSSTGQTLDYIGDAIKDSAKSVAVHVAEFDPRRLMLDTGNYRHFNPGFSPTSTSIVRVESHPDGRFVSIPTREIYSRIRQANKQA